MNNQRKKVILVPIDNRPVTYSFPQLLASIAGIDAIVPSFELIGSFKGPARIEALSEWLIDTITKLQPDAITICLDSLLYGGLVASRRSDDSTDIVLQRANCISEWKELSSKKLTVFAQSSIMRISNNYFNNTEKAYWSQYGKEIFRWSQLLHQQKRNLLSDESELKDLAAKIDTNIQTDYLNTRKRNFQVNLRLIEYAKSKAIDLLIFSQDDTGEFGLNVMEKEELLAHCKSKGLDNVIAYAGADEVLMTMLARWLILNSKQKPRISLHFIPDEGKKVLSNYEGQTLEESITTQIKAASLDTVSTTNETEDFAVIVHTAGTIQGDHVCLPGNPDLTTLDTSAPVGKTLQLLEKLTVPAIICDVAYTNGSDPLLVTKLIERKDLINKLWGYAGWNTTGNTIGSALAMGVARWYANQNAYDTKEATKRAMFVRLADDWAYQTQVRSKLSGQPSEELLEQLMAPFLQKLSTCFDFEPGLAKVNFPWQRTFEIAVNLADKIKAVSPS